MRLKSKYWKEFLLSLFLALDDYVGCQIEDTQQEQAQLTKEGDKPYTVSWFIRVLICF